MRDTGKSKVANQSHDRCGFRIFLRGREHHEASRIHDLLVASDLPISRLEHFRKVTSNRHAQGVPSVIDMRSIRTHRANKHGEFTLFGR